jgi:hypothetical protein
MGMIAVADHARAMIAIANDRRGSTSIVTVRGAPSIAMRGVR